MKAEGVVFVGCAASATPALIFY